MKQTIRFSVMLLLFLGFCLNSLLARTDNNRQTVSYNFHNFTDLEVSGVATVYFTQSNNYSITVTEGNNPILKTIIEKSGKKLIVRKKDSENVSVSCGDSDLPIVYITAPHLNAIKSSGLVHVNVKSLKTDDFNLNISGAANVAVENVQCSSLNIKGSGISKLKIQVEAKGNAKLMFSGASHNDVTFKGEHLDLNSSGVGNINLIVDCKSLTASNSGASNVNISGTADDTKIKGSGVAKINTSGLNCF